MKDIDSFLEAHNIDKNQIMKSIPFDKNPTAVFLSGSILEGYGNKTSDLDVFLLYSGKVPTQRLEYTAIDNESGSGGISFEFVENLRLDIEHWTEESLFSIAEKIRLCSFDNWDDSLRFQFFETLTAHRIRIGIPIHNVEKFSEIQNAFDFQKLSRIIMIKKLAKFNGMAEDTSGAIASRQAATSLLVSRECMELGIDVWLSANGETNEKSKWRFLKLAKFGDQDLSDQYWKMETRACNSENEAIDQASDNLRFAQKLVLRAQIITRVY